MTIVFDVDGPLIGDNSHHFFAYANRQPEIRRNGTWDFSTFIQTGDWEQATKLVTDDISKYFREFRRSTEFPGERPTPGAQSALRSLANHDRFVATMRPHSERGSTTGFLAKHFPPFVSTRFNAGLEKAEAVAGWSAQFFIEDTLPLAHHVAKQTNAAVILFPVRGQREIPKHPQLITLEAEQLTGSDMPNKDWEDVCRSAWEQIVTIIK